MAEASPRPRASIKLRLPIFHGLKKAEVDQLPGSSGTVPANAAPPPPPLPPPPPAQLPLHLPASSSSSAAAGMPLNRRRITEFIADKQLRLRSYVRRRPIPFKRVAELDVACGTKSIMIQYCADFDECLYMGHEALVDKFVSPTGIRLTDVEDVVRKCKEK
jgi:hypothetical protein